MELLDFLSRLVEIDTVNSPENNIRPVRDNVIKIGDYIGRELNADVQVIENKGYYTIYGEYGYGRPIILMLAHFDTVPVNMDEWRFDPFKLTVIDNMAYGRGSLDDKGNIACIIYALKEVLRIDYSGTIILAVTGDEEIGGRYGALAIRDMLLNRGKKPDYVINADGNGLAPIIRRRNAFSSTIKIPAKKIRVMGVSINKRFKAEILSKETRHAAYFTPGVDIHPLLAISEYLRYHENCFIKSLSGGWVKGNVIPGWAKINGILIGGDREYIVDENLTRLVRSLVVISRMSVEVERNSEFGVTITPNYYKLEGNIHKITLDIRAMTTKYESIQNKILNILSTSGVEGAEVDVKGGTGYLYTPANSKLVKTAINIQRKLGLNTNPREMAGASDSRFFSPLNIQCIDYGPIGGNIHGPNEYVNIDSLYKAKDFYMLLLRSLLISKYK